MPEEKEGFESIAVKSSTKKRFKLLKSYKQTDDEFLIKILDVVEGNDVDELA